MPAVLATLTFAAPAMLGFLAAAVLPWLIARRHRPAMQAVGLATTALVITAARRRPRWKRPLAWLIPFLRSLLIAAVVTATAGPTWLSQPQPERSPSRRVLILDDSAQFQASRAIGAAVEALAEADAGNEQAWISHTVPSAAVTSGSLPDDIRIVILADGAAPSTAVKKALRAFCDRGGGLLVLLGPASTSAEAAPLTEWLADAAGIRLAGVRSDGHQSIRRPSGTWTWLPALAGPTVATHAVLEPLTSCQSLLETVGSSQPLLVACRRGQGTTVVSALPWTLPKPHISGQPGDAWSDLPAWPVFLEIVADVCDMVAPDNRAERNAPLLLNPSTNSAGTPLAGICLLTAIVLAGLDPLLGSSRQAGRPTS